MGIFCEVILNNFISAYAYIQIAENNRLVAGYYYQFHVGNPGSGDPADRRCLWSHYYSIRSHDFEHADFFAGSLDGK